MLISVVIPVYNSKVLEELTERIERVFAGRVEQHEVLFVDDFSPDPAVWVTLERIAARYPSVRAVQLTRNFGQHAATICGLREARGEFVITMDDDLEHSPEEIPKLLDMREHDLVVGRFKERQHGLLTRASSRIKGTFDWFILGKPRHIQLTSFRMLSRVVVDGMLAIRTAHPFIPALMLHVTKNVVAVDMDHRRRARGRSSYTFLKRLRLFTDLIIHNSSLVLRVVGQLGLAIAALSFLMAGYIVYRKLQHSIGVLGWASVVTVQLLIGGLLLFSVGVIGEYLVRIIESSEAKPTYFVRRRAGHPAGVASRAP